MIFGKWYLVLALISGLIACSSAKKQFIPVLPADPASSTVYIYRSQSLSNIVISPVLSVNGLDKFPIKNDRYSYLQLEPGTYIFQLELDENFGGEKSLELAVKPGSRYYLKVTPALKFERNRPYSRAFSIQRIPETQAFNEIKDCGYMEAKMPSKYLWSENSPGNTSLSDPVVKDSEFNLNKSRDPFSKLK